MELLRLYRHFAVLIFSSAFLAACAQTPAETPLSTRQHINERMAQITSQFTKTNPELATAMNESAGFLVCSSERVVIAAIGTQSGHCVLSDNSTKQQTVYDLNSLSLGLGVGATDESYLAIFTSTETLNQWRDGQLHLSFDSSYQSGESDTQSIQGEKAKIYKTTNSGSVVAATVDLANLSVNQELSEVEYAKTGIPNKSKDATKRPVADTYWPYRLPFLAKDVLAQGYDLPRPYALSVNVANVEQNMNLTGLNVGFNGASPTPYEFVDFSNPITDLKSIQLKADAWIFPFMNVFAMLGKVDGDITMDVLLDGNGMLEQLGKQCEGVIKPPACFVLQDKQFTLPIRAKVRPITYGVGTTLAGGWNDFFFALPMTVTWSEPAKALLDGRSVTITPRAGYVFDLGTKGRFSAFIGANYLDSENAVEGFIVIPGINTQLNYQINQANTDRWNALVGFNWDISEKLSWNLEYNGFYGSRTALISGLTFRF